MQWGRLKVQELAGSRERRDISEGVVSLEAAGARAPRREHRRREQAAGPGPSRDQGEEQTPARAAPASATRLLPTGTDLPP